MDLQDGFYWARSRTATGTHTSRALTREIKHSYTRNRAPTQTGYRGTGGALPKPLSEASWGILSFLDFTLLTIDRNSISVSEEELLRTEVDIVKCATQIVAAYVSNHSVPVADLPSVIANVHSLLGGFVNAPRVSAAGEDKRPAALGAHKQVGKAAVEHSTPAVSISSSLKPGHIVCLEDGKKFKTLKRHLKSEHGFTPDEYRARWGLAADYPMVAPHYAARRSSLAKAIGLGSMRNKNKRNKR